MAWLVHAQRSASWERDVDEPTPSLVVDCGAANVQLPHPDDKLFDISNHQVELVLSTRLGRMKRDLGWREAEDEPTATNIDVREAQDIAEERPIQLGVGTVDDGMGSHDHVIPSSAGGQSPHGRSLAAAQAGYHAPRRQSDPTECSPAAGKCIGLLGGRREIVIGTPLRVGLDIPLELVSANLCSK